MKNTRNNWTLYESIMCKVGEVVKQALDESGQDVYDAINSSSDGDILWNVNLAGDLYGINVYADESDDAIDIAFDWAAEHEPNMLNDKEAFAMMNDFEKTHDIDDDEAYDAFMSEFEDIFYSGGNEGVHYTYRDDFSICKVDW